MKSLRYTLGRIDNGQLESRMTAGKPYEPHRPRSVPVVVRTSTRWCFTYKSGAAVRYGGSMWIARGETRAKPGEANEASRAFVRNAAFFLPPSSFRKCPFMLNAGFLLAISLHRHRDGQYSRAGPQFTAQRENLGHQPAAGVAAGREGTVLRQRRRQKVCAVPSKPGPTFDFDPAPFLFEMRADVYATRNSYIQSPDGRRFLDNMLLDINAPPATSSGTGRRR